MKLSLEKKIEENDKKNSIEKLSGNLLNDDTKTFQTVSKEKQKMMDPQVQKKIIEKTLGKPENQKFGNEERTKGDKAGDLLFQNTWEYKPLEINDFQFDVENLGNVEMGEYKWNMPKKTIENSHKIIQRKNYIGDVNVVSKKEEKEISDFTFKPMTFDFSGNQPNSNNFGGFGQLDSLDDVQTDEFSTNFNFNKGEMNHHIINNEKNIGDIEIMEMETTIPKNDNSSSTSIEIDDPNSKKSEKTEKTPISDKNESFKPFVNPDTPNFEFKNSELSSEKSNTTGGYDPSKFKKPEINTNVTDNKKKIEETKIHQKSENSSEIETRETSPKNSPKISKKTSQKSNPTEATHNTKSFPHDKYNNIEVQSSLPSGESSVNDESLMSFKPVIPGGNNIFENKDLESEATTSENSKSPTKKPTINPKIEIHDNHKEIRDINVTDKDEESEDSITKKNSSLTSEPDNMKIKKNSEESDEISEGSDLTGKVPSKKTSQIVDQESEEISESVVSQKTPEIIKKDNESTSEISENEISEKTPKKEPSNHSSEISIHEDKSEKIEKPKKSHKTIEDNKKETFSESEESDESSDEISVVEKEESESKSSEKPPKKETQTPKIETKSSNSEDSPTDTESEDTDRFLVDEDESITIDNLHKKKKKRRNKFPGKTIIALQFTKSERRLASVNPRSHEEKRREILVLFNLLPSCVKKALLSCKPQSQPAIEKCEKNLPNSNCETQNMIAQFSCGKHETFFNNACYQNCPNDMKDDSLICLKSLSKRRSAEIWSGNEEDIDRNIEEIFGGKLKVMKCEVFGESYQAIGADLCVQKCPYGWRNLGNSCLKPVRFLNQPKIVLEADFE